jgi:GT2 family glycosyltransferase
MNDPKVIISVLNWVRYQDTLECVRRILRQDYSEYEIVVADNGSFNESVAILKESFPGIKIIELKKNKGFAAGHQYSADYALERNAELLWILNPDTIVRPDSLRHLADAYHRTGPALYGSITLKSENPDVIHFGGGEEIKNNPGEIPFSYNLYENRVLDDCRGLNERKVQSVEGSSMLIPVDLIRKYGFMDPRFFLYGEETDYCMRLWDRGIPSIVVPSSIVLHKGAGSTDRQDEGEVIRVYYRTRNWRLIARKYFGLKRSEMIRSRGGVIAFLKFYFSWIFAGKVVKLKNRLNYYENLAVLHAVLNIRGKRVSPEKFLYTNSEKA